MTNVALAPDLYSQYWNATATAPLVGGKLFSYIAGTTTKQATYTDSTGTVANANPIILDSVAHADIWLDTSLQYKFVLASANDTDPPSSPIWTKDNVSSLPLQSAQAIGSLINPQTPAESILPPNLQYSTLPFADVRRYGCVCNGSTDDTAAFTAALSVAAATGLALVIPYGYKLKITGYVPVPSNCTLYIFGMLQLTGRQSGLYCNGASNVGIHGCKIGNVQDSTVVGSYVWNPGTGNTAPAIHIRSSNHVTIDGLNISYCSQGVFTSNATQNYVPQGTPFNPSQAYPVDVKIRDCTMTFCEWSGIATLSSYDSGYYNNYVYRCGDGGLWMMGAIRGEVVGNKRVSPQTVYADTLTYGQNSAGHPTTWNDVQGMEFEGCHDLLIANNLVEYIQGEGIDIKQNCNRVLCIGNRVTNCEQFSIVVREGDPGDVGSCYKVTICDNTISNHGYTMFSTTPQFAVAAAISVSSDFLSVIKDNTIFSYQMTPGIYCAGPGQYQVNQYGGNPQQAALTVTGNVFEFMASNPYDTSEFQFTSSTLSAIQIEGSYTSVKCDGNHIKTDRYYYSDARINAYPAISLTTVFPAWTSGTAYVSGNVVYTGPGGGIYTCILANTNQPPPNATYWVLNSSGATASSSFYPTSASISNNEIVGWGFTGIQVIGQSAMTYSGLAVNGNVISGAGGYGIQLQQTNYAVCNNNAISQCNNSVTATYTGIYIYGLAGATVTGVACTGNSFTGAWNVGGNNMAYCISVAYAVETNLSNNVMAGAVTSTLTYSNITGNMVLQGSTGFPRTNAGSPNGAVTSFWRGEMLYDTTNLKWWAASTFQSTTWTQLSN